MVTSRITRKVAIIVETATMARRTRGLIRCSSSRSSQLDHGDDGHAGHEQRLPLLAGLEHELDGDALQDLHEVAGGVLGRPEPAPRARAPLDRVPASAAD